MLCFWHTVEITVAGLATMSVQSDMNPVFYIAVIIEIDSKVPLRPTVAGKNVEIMIKCFFFFNLKSKWLPFESLGIQLNYTGITSIYLCPCLVILHKQIKHCLIGTSLNKSKNVWACTLAWNTGKLFLLYNVQPNLCLFKQHINI